MFADSLSFTELQPLSSIVETCGAADVRLHMHIQLISFWAVGFAPDLPDAVADALLALGHITSELFLHLPLHLLKAGSVLLTTRPKGVVLGFEGVSCALLESIWHLPDVRGGLRVVRLEPIF